MVEKTSDLRVLATELVRRANDETRRTRLLEQKVDRFEADMQTIENTMSSYSGEIKVQLESIQKVVKSISDRLLVIENAVGRMEKEMAKRATKAEVKQLDSYISLVSPMTSRFVTREEMDRAINDKLVKKY